MTSGGRCGAAARGPHDARPMTTSQDAAAERWLVEHRTGTDAATALRFFDRLPAVGVQDVVAPEHVLPTLFRDGAGRPVPVDPVLAPVALIRRRPGLLRRGPVPVLFRAALPLLRSPRPAGRIRRVEVRGVVSAALVYDSVPIVDAFRRVTPDLLLGAGDIRGEAAPLMFVLRRSRAAGPGPSRPATSPAPGIPRGTSEE